MNYLTEKTKHVTESALCVCFLGYRYIQLLLLLPLIMLKSFGESKNSLTIIFLSTNSIFSWPDLNKVLCLTLKSISCWVIYICPRLLSTCGKKHWNLKHGWLCIHTLRNTLAADTHNLHSIKIVHQTTEVHDFTLSPHFLASEAEDKNNKKVRAAVQNKQLLRKKALSSQI